MDPIPDKDKIVYIIAASHLEHEDASDEKFAKLHHQIDSVMVQQKNMIREIYNLQQRMIQMQMSQQSQEEESGKKKETLSRDASKANHHHLHHK